MFVLKFTGWVLPSLDFTSECIVFVTVMSAF